MPDRTAVHKRLIHNLTILRQGLVPNLVTALLSRIVDKTLMAAPGGDIIRSRPQSDFESLAQIIARVSEYNEKAAPHKARRITRDHVLAALSMGGVAWVLLQYIVARQAGMFPIPGGDTMLWDRTGDAVRAGLPVYVNIAEPFFYAPPVAVFLGAVTWLPPELLNVGTTALSILALRLIAGSWRAAGIACWFPLVTFALVDGNVNLLIAASIVLAVRGDGRLAALTALMKVSPLLVIRDRRALVVWAVAFAVTLPFLGLWPQWIAHLAGAFGHTYGPMIGIPLTVRLLVAIPLLLGRPWMRALGAVIAIPGFYWGSLVVLIAPVAVWLRVPPRR